MDDSATSPLAALYQAGLEFTSRCAHIGDRWDDSTICDDWTVGSMVDHIIGGSRMTVGLLEGATRDQAIELLSVVPGADRIAAMHTAVDAQSASFDGVELAAITVHHPAVDMDGIQLLGFRTLDLALHAWDLARSLGIDERLDEHVVGTVWDFLQPLAPVIGQLGMFGTGPSGDVADDAPLQTRLLDLTGRRP
jgi:uncharacterized protein (TIGR03086 family)